MYTCAHTCKRNTHCCTAESTNQITFSTYINVEYHLPDPDLFADLLTLFPSPPLSVKREAEAADREAHREGELCGEAELHHQARAVLACRPKAPARLPLPGADAVRPRVHQAGQGPGG